ncbi:hypothetical protein QWJ26_08800 [Streptomyces sp. CSDS2]|uniref:hypothetical protein n=1 Tax=Streptomyces sp. CSDS2 TaxID=3055051 RepID=UPI0025B1403C|nr:hypothetical protein [Streptomyces sp. CSDS2]MDN3259901.1 hypothetical protein [Streptomyces sp. CSDS2]
MRKTSEESKTLKACVLVAAILFATTSPAAARQWRPMTNDYFAVHAASTSDGPRGPRAPCPDITLLARYDKRPPATVVKEGFKLPGDGSDYNLLRHVYGASTLGHTGKTAFVSTSKTVQAIKELVERKRYTDGYVYFVDPSDERVYDVNETLEATVNAKDEVVGKDAKSEAKTALEVFSWQQEVSIVGDVEPRSVVEGWHVKNDMTLVQVYIRPGWKPGNGAIKSTFPVPLFLQSRGTASPLGKDEVTAASASTVTCKL